MSTITSPGTILTMLKNGGKYPGDPPMKLIYSYLNQSGVKEWAIFEDYLWDDIADNPYLSEGRLLMKDGNLTADGNAELARLKSLNLPSLYY